MSEAEDSAGLTVYTKFRTPSHLLYITGTGRYRHKKRTEHITCDPQIASLRSQESFLSEYGLALAPDPSKGQRRGKRTDLRIIISWLGNREDRQLEFLDDFMAEHFEGCLWTWARHVKPNRLGQTTSHFHIVVCPRKFDGSMLDVRKDDLKRLKGSYLKLSNQLGLAAGWDMANKPESKTPQVRERRHRARRPRARQQRRISL
ncbi:hypothetical protein FE236_13240 [Mariprofundus erugo]|uniref:hypothetical protein n=1 Tax=Mariprofundus erugo TaxID=2528639 RepID=UPI0010FE9032|nr:hypothetical protein [Mariprofundus erugo]TLS73458.1 hypothetical protein FE236_13240 [Mariprofundus erugo]